ncbi:MAG: hypothetical protein HGB08_03780 [Candidatus Moranbacteria bacterium]|nr:hypothetical protein [Candidatus Moranbacteria bacterium]
MHQTFYIDIDEEITSIAERLRKAETKDVIMVVPKQASLIQSIVNLKLLKKEAQKKGINLIMVTQDKLGRVLIEKAGISVEQKLEDVEGEEVFIDEKPKNGQGKAVKKEGSKIVPARKVDRIGSDSFFDANKDDEVFISARDDKRREDDDAEEEPEEKITNTELVTGIASDIKKRKPTRMDLTAGKAKSKDNNIKIKEKPVKKEDGIFLASSIPEEEAQDSGRPNADVDSFDHFFSGRPNHSSPDIYKAEERGFAKKERQSGSSKKGIFKYVLAVMSLAAGCAVLYWAYLFVPEATIEITTKRESTAGDVGIIGDAKIGSIDYGSKMIPAKLIEVNAQVSDSFSTSGNSSVSSNKSHGKVVIYNEFSNSSQPLVATTRLESTDGKIFRLVAGVTVPGFTKSGDTITPGSVEASVVADNSGDTYNIDPATFTIPGFKNSGGDKYAKFYAKSTEAMSGGGSGNSEANSVTESDISSAKGKILVKLNDALRQNAKNSAGDGMVLLSDAVNFDEPSYNPSVSVGEVTNTFNMSASGRAQAIVFKEDDIKKLSNDIISKSGGGKSNINSGSLVLDYGKSSADFKLETINIKAHATNETPSSIDVANLKRGMLGKNNDELETYLKSYSSIEKAEVTYWPPLIASKVPIYEGRVKIIVDSGEAQ